MSDTKKETPETTAPKDQVTPRDVFAGLYLAATANRCRAGNEAEHCERAFKWADWMMAAREKKA